MNEQELKFAQQYAEIAKLFIDLSIQNLLKDMEIAKLKNEIAEMNKAYFSDN